MKTKRIYLAAAVLVLLTVLALSACKSDDPEESFLYITIKGGPQQYQAIINSSESWDDMDLDNKKSIALDCVTSCQKKNPPAEFSLKGFNKADNKELFTWNSTDELYYIDGEKVDR